MALREGAVDCGTHRSHRTAAGKRIPEGRGTVVSGAAWEEAGEPGYLDAHPLVRVYFQEELQRERPKAWAGGGTFGSRVSKKAAAGVPRDLEDDGAAYAAVVPVAGGSAAGCR